MLLIVDASSIYVENGKMADVLSEKIRFLERWSFVHFCLRYVTTRETANINETKKIMSWTRIKLSRVSLFTFYERH